MSSASEQEGKRKLALILSEKRKKARRMSFIQGYSVFLDNRRSLPRLRLPPWSEHFEGVAHTTSPPGYQPTNLSKDNLPLFPIFVRL